MSDDDNPFSAHNWTIRQWIAHWIHQLGYAFDSPEEHTIIVRDPGGTEFCSIAFSGGFVASHPPPPYTFHCLHSDGEIDL